MYIFPLSDIILQYRLRFGLYLIGLAEPLLETFETTSCPYDPFFDLHRVEISKLQQVLL